MPYRLGIDIGGTFTDFILVDAEGESRLYKVSSTPEDPSRAIEEGLELIAEDRGLTATELLAATDLVIHGTTVVINTLIQTAGAKTGLLCTEGFRDTFEIRLGFKERRYDFSFAPPPVLVPRQLRLPVRERVTKEGAIHMPLDEDDVRRHARTFREEGVDAVAVSLLWSFANDVHERRVGEILAEELPEAFLSLSVDVLPQIRDYERTSTTIVNAYVGPILRRYIDRIETMFRGQGFGQRIRYMQTNAGVASAEALMRKPVTAVNSGPAAAPTAALFFGRQLGHENLVSIDMGGTSFDVCVVRDGMPDTVKNVDVCRYRIGISMINVKAIGAGGGSIAWVDAGGILRVGPRSAEAVPGPACYRRGGTEPTVTDANVVLGYLGTAGLLGGRLPIDAAAAAGALRTIGDPLGLTLDEVSRGVFEVVNHNMAGGISEVLIERGYDPRDFVMVVGGGAGPVHAGHLAQQLGIPKIVVPKVASAFCAFGEVVADLRHDYQASYATRLTDAEPSRLSRLFDEMEERGRSELAEEGVEPEDMVMTRWLDLHYLGQVHECTVSIPSTPVDDSTIDAIAELFHTAHESLYTYAERDGGIPELMNLGVTALGRAPEISLPELPSSGRDAASAHVGERPVHFGEDSVRTPVYDGTKLDAGASLAGPAVVEERTTTIIVLPGWELELDPRGFYTMSGS